MAQAQKLMRMNLDLQYSQSSSRPSEVQRAAQDSSGNNILQESASSYAAAASSTHPRNNDEF